MILFSSYCAMCCVLCVLIRGVLGNGAVNSHRDFYTDSSIVKYLKTLELSQSPLLDHNDQHDYVKTPGR